LLDRNDVGLLRDGARFDSALFMRLLERTIAEEDYPRFIEEALLIDTSTFLTEEDYFVLDGHINARGHRKVAGHILEALETEKHILGDAITLRTTPEARAAYSVDDNTEPLPDAAFQSEIVSDRETLTVPDDADHIEFTLTVHNRSPHWWFVQRSRKPYFIRIRPQLKDSDGRIVNRSFPGGMSTMRYPTAPGSSFEAPIRIAADALPEGTSYLEFDVVLEQYAWFKDRGGKTATIRIEK